MRLPRPAREPLDLPLSPLIDVIFILLIFVVLVARFTEDERIDVSPPETRAGRPVTAEDGALVVVLERDGRLSIRGGPVAAEQLPAVLQAARPTHDAVVLLGDAGVHLQGAVDVLGAAAAAGFEEVGVVTRPPAEPPAE